jgi:hypothetical protein
LDWKNKRKKIYIMQSFSLAGSNNPYIFRAVHFCKTKDGEFVYLAVLITGIEDLFPWLLVHSNR